MTKIPVFKGACTAIVTPFCESGIDYERLRKNLDYQYEHGISAVVVCGTTGENATLNTSEREELLRRAVYENRGRMKLIAGIGGNNTDAVCRNAESAKCAGADAVLMTTPYYNKTSQMGLIRHFSYVADRVDIPVILYNVPSRTAIGISAQTYKELSKHPNINGVKEASGDLSLAMATRALCGDDLFIWSGNDDNIVPLMAIGALGVISVASNILPEVLVRVCDLCLKDRFPEATRLYCQYAELFSALFIETNPMPLKAAMGLMGMDSGKVRLPLTALSAEHFQTLEKLLQRHGLCETADDQSSSTDEKTEG